MKKCVLLALVVVMLMGLLAGCRRQNTDETTTPTGNETVMPTVTTTRPTTMPTTETTRPTTNPISTAPGTVPTEDMTTGSDPLGTRSRNQIMPPR